MNENLLYVEWWEIDTKYVGRKWWHPFTTWQATAVGYGVTPTVYYDETSYIYGVTRDEAVLKMRTLICNDIAKVQTKFNNRKFQTKKFSQDAICPEPENKHGENYGI